MFYDKYVFQNSKPYILGGRYSVIVVSELSNGSFVSHGRIGTVYPLYCTIDGFYHPNYSAPVPEDYGIGITANEFYD